MTSTSVDMENLRDVLKFVIQLLSSKDEIYESTFCKLWFFLDTQLSLESVWCSLWKEIMRQV